MYEHLHSFVPPFAQRVDTLEWEEGSGRHLQLCATMWRGRRGGQLVHTTWWLMWHVMAWHAVSSPAFLPPAAAVVPEAQATHALFTTCWSRVQTPVQSHSPQAGSPLVALTMHHGTECALPCPAGRQLSPV